MWNQTTDAADGETRGSTCFRVVFYNQCYSTDNLCVTTQQTNFEGVKDSRIQRTFIRQHKHVDKHLNKLGNITVHEY